MHVPQYFWKETRGNTQHVSHKKLVEAAHKGISVVMSYRLIVNNKVTQMLWRLKGFKGSN